ncbi:LacI family DNA-binding transcriptional regulator [Salisediminibacterium selenitireducens]|uniref:Transcriptional regulator, LacI family n=1 Tax=Bacillus selenitireducens (strain ATCC 700615 / DSM 15326 / MLS10) TaxID=439292 RepID=D6XX99_BACIE|nr:LacI family DNA-binding transcriptional regulator [Salisediminibacterium selenitireducens]ADH97956.1 transcriptional regulator, LacI family [[Bacillus] selenitireducens MLS10]
MATMKDIAEKSGYSIATVSRVLNQDASLAVTDATKEKIFQVAQSLGYKTLRDKRSEKEAQDPSRLTMGLVYYRTEEQELSDPYFLSIRLGVENKCARMGVTLEKIYRENDNAALQIPSDVDGLIVVGRVSEGEIARLREVTGSLTFVDYPADSRQYDAVVIDFAEAMEVVLAELTGLGHRSIGFIGGHRHFPPDEIVRDEREHAFRYYLDRRGLLDEALIYTGDFNTSEGYRLMTEALQAQNRPTAFFIASDSMAIGAYRAAFEAGVRIPEDLSVVGFNDISASSYLQPSLSTVKVYTEFMGETAVDLAIERIRTKREIPKKVVLPTEFIRRESLKERTQSSRNKT